MRRGARTRARDARKAVRSVESALNQLPSRVLDNPFPPLCPLSSDQLEEIHNASLTVLESLGIEVTSDRVREKFRSLDGSVDESTQNVRIDRELIMALIDKAPRQFTLTPRNPDHQLLIGGNRINCGLVSGPPNVHDRINGRRSGNFLDYQRLIKLGQTFNVINFFGNQSIAPTDLPANTRHLDTYRENIILSDKVFSAVPIGKGRIDDAVNMVALSRGITPAELCNDPALIGNININSPRKLEDAMSDAALALAHHGQAVIVTPFTLLGAMTPVTLAAGLVQQNAEALFGLAMIQHFTPAHRWSTGVSHPMLTCVLVRQRSARRRTLRPTWLVVSSRDVMGCRIELAVATLLTQLMPRQFMKPRCPCGVVFWVMGICCTMRLAGLKGGL